MFASEKQKQAPNYCTKRTGISSHTVSALITLNRFQRYVAMNG